MNIGLVKIHVNLLRTSSTTESINTVKLVLTSVQVVNGISPGNIGLVIQQ